MNEKKYELTNETIKWYGRTLYRIKALKDFSDVKKGALGGYIEKESNLSQYDECWVYDEAKIYGNSKVYRHARVYDNAEICGNAIVYGDAVVYSNAKVYDNALVYGYARVHDNARVYGNAYIYGYARVYDNALVYGYARVHDNARVYGNAKVYNWEIIGEISMSYKDIFQHQCRNRMLTAILTDNNKILYTIGCQNNITKEQFLDRIYHENGGIEENPHRKEYLKLIKYIEMYFSE